MVSSSPSWGKYALWGCAQETALLCSDTIWLHIRFEPCVTLMLATLDNNGSIEHTHTLSLTHTCAHTHERVCTCVCSITDYTFFISILLYLFQFDPSAFIAQFHSSSWFSFRLSTFPSLSFILHIAISSFCCLIALLLAPSEIYSCIGHWCCVRAPSNPPKPMSIVRIC